MQHRGLTKTEQAERSAEQPSSGYPVAVMPPPEVYEAEYYYWPWGNLINWCAEWVERSIPDGGTVFDYMCGTGYLLALIQKKRPDLQLFGCDIDRPFVDYAHRNYSKVVVRCADARHLCSSEKLNLIVCTGGLHHLTFSDQEMFLDKLHTECGLTTSLLIGEEVIGAHGNERSRRLESLRLGSALIEYGIQNNWPDEQVDAAIEVLQNDVLLRGEYKRSASQWMESIGRRFLISETHWTWKARGGGGDFVLVCRPR
jgi:SAM-dependent methyltransferase